MTPKEGFKYGFLLRCAEEGLTVKEAEARAARGFEKRAQIGELLSNVGGGIKDIVTGAPSMLGRLAGSGLGIGLGASAIGGGLTGYGLAKMQEGDVDPQEVQREELIAAYRAQAELARRKAIMEAAQRAQARPKSFHGI